jgi:hypothetical protein
MNAYQERKEQEQIAAHQAHLQRQYDAQVRQQEG